VYMVGATPQQYQLKGSFKIPVKQGEPGYSKPAISNGRLYLRDLEMLWCYDVKASK